MQRYKPRRCRSPRSHLVLSIAIVLAGLVIAKPTDCLANDPSSDGEKRPLVICAVPDAMPHTGRADDGSPQGLDVAVAQLLAKEMRRPIEFHWCASASCSWNCLRERRCDVIVGQPHESRVDREVAWSIPYSSGRFGLVVHQDTKGIHTHADLHGKQIGTVTGSVAVGSQERATVPFKTREELLENFVAKGLDAAIVDDDFAAWYLHHHPELPLQRVAEYASRERWNMGFAVRSKDEALLRDVNRALTNIVQNGQVSRLYAEQGISYRAPFSDPKAKQVASNSWERIRERGELVVSLDPTNLPYSSAHEDGSGFDFELAQALASALGLKLRVDWIDIQRETAIGKLLDGHCDVAFGAAIEPRAVDDEVDLAGKVVYSKPYYGTGYLLVTRRNGPTANSLAELKGERSRRIGTEAGSVADFRLRQRGYLRRLFRTQLSVLKSLNDGGIDYAYLWANVGWTLHATPEFDVEIVADSLPEDYWNIAIAMRHGDDELKRHVDDCIDRLVDDGTVSQALSRYHVPYFAAFGIVNDCPASTSTRSTSAAPRSTGQVSIIRHQPTDRGPEPQMQRAQRSKQPYSAIERIRSAGVLVVGMDQNCLPFSAAHPTPAGLDYEIAGLLADKLGVSLSVFWAYSSHDSYPSKLAYKKLCDVMLGVMPDDRFGDQVAFSKPYYFTEYRFVVPADATAPNDNAAVAFERGVAMRGIRGRRVHEYSSLERILDAVVKREESAGYVISTQGQWLAEQRWPGQLRFVRSDVAVDRFPIYAAMRKRDDDLRNAINEALDDLAQSGQLADVFGRWHVPYAPPAAARHQPQVNTAK
jgi:ABC-type amino acid transport substrate-binding protein